MSAALTFSRGIGIDRKIARLRYLRDRWAKALLAESPRVKVLTPLTGDKSGAICLFSVDGLDPVKLGGWLWDKYKIVNTPIVHPEFSGIRITPNVYTTTAGDRHVHGGGDEGDPGRTSPERAAPAAGAFTPPAAPSPRGTTAP